MTSEFPHDRPFDPADAKIGGWAHIELLGHREEYGFVREIQAFGIAMCEVLVPIHDREEVRCDRHVYGGASIYGIHSIAKDDVLHRAPHVLHDTLRPPQLTIGIAADDDEPDDGDTSDDDLGPEF